MSATLKSSSNDPMFDRYSKALEDLKRECQHVVPIRLSHFITDHKTHALFFNILISNAVIEMVVKGKNKEGNLYEWVYKPASNEQLAKLVCKTIDWIRTYDRVAKAKQIAEKRNPKTLAKKHEAEVKQAKANTPTTREQALIKYILLPHENELAELQRALIQAQAKFDEKRKMVMEMYKELGVIK